MDQDISGSLMDITYDILGTFRVRCPGSYPASYPVQISEARRRQTPTASPAVIALATAEGSLSARALGSPSESENKWLTEEALTLVTRALHTLLEI